LKLRSIYYQKDEACEAHIFFGLLAYRIVNTIRTQLMKKGIRHDWTEQIRIMAIQKAVTTSALNKLGEIVRVRTCTIPEKTARTL
jgi:hypothetical protein